MDEGAWSAWLDRLVPLRDDGKTLLLACTSMMAGRVVERDYGELVGGIVGREIVCELRDWAADALAKRDKGRARQGKEASEPSKPSETVLDYRRMEIGSPGSPGSRIDALTDRDRKAADEWLSMGDLAPPESIDTEAA